MDIIDRFDKIFIIHCIENEQRYNNILYQASKLSCSSSEKIEVYTTCYFPFNEICANALVMSGKSRYITNGPEFSLAREFYRIIKTSYLGGLERILIFEDDFSLINESYLNRFMDDLPEDFDIVQFSLQINSNMCDYKKLFDLYNKGILWTKKEFGGWSNNGVGFSRKGMKYWLDSMDREFQAADIPTHESKNTNKYWGYCNMSDETINHYVSTIPLVYIDGNDSTVQFINQEHLYEMYRKINKSIYNIYNIQ